MKKNFCKVRRTLVLSCMGRFIFTMGERRYGRIAYSGGKVFYATAFSSFEPGFS